MPLVGILASLAALPLFAAAGLGLVSFSPTLRDRPLPARLAWERFWWMAPVVLPAGARALRRRAVLPFLVAISGGLVIFLLSYGGSAWDPAGLVRPTWNRFMIQLALPFFILFDSCLREVLFPKDPSLLRPSERESAPAFAT